MTFHKDHILPVIALGFFGLTFSIAAAFFLVQTILRVRRAERIPGKVLKYQEQQGTILALIEYADPSGATRRSTTPVGRKPCAEGEAVGLLRDRMTPTAVWIAPSFLSLWWLPLLLLACAALFLAGAIAAAFYDFPR